MTAVPGPPLVTGGAGFAGSHLVERLLASQDSVAAWSNPASRSPTGGDPRVRWTAVDLLQPPAVQRALAELRPSVIYHCAGLPHVAEAWANAAAALRVNAFGTYVLLESVKRAGLDCPVLVVGSALVYRASLEPLAEEDPIGPSDPYGISKVAQEIAGRQAGTPVFLARPFNHAGPRQLPAFAMSNFARQIAAIEHGSHEPVLSVGNLDARRDLTDVRDTVRGYEAIVRAGRAGVPYNVCTGRAHRVGDLLETMLRMSRVAIRVQQDEKRLRPSDNPIVCGDPSRITAETGWRAEIPIERTLSDLLDWWRAQTAAA